MRVLWHSNAPWSATGYGVQTGLFAPRVRDQGHEVAISAFYGLQGGMLRWKGLEVYPGGNHPYGNDVLPLHAAAHFGEDPGLILLLADAWVIQPEALAGFRSAIWCPVDHDPCQPPTVRMLHKTGCRPIAMSRHGERMLRNEGLDPLYVPHGFDAEVFHPVPQAEARERLGIPGDAFLVGVVAANKGNAPVRKSWPQVLQAFKRLRSAHADALLYLHTDGMGLYNGVNIMEMGEAFDIPRPSMRFANQYRNTVGFPPEYMRDVYSAMDVLLNPSMGEGFGVPIVEAQACGVPVIVTDWTAMPELVGAGWKVGGERTWTPLGSWMLTPSIDQIVDALNVAYGRRGDAKLRERAMEFAAGYEADFVAAQFWKPAMEALSA